MPVSDNAIDIAFDMWASVWDKKNRQKGGYKFALKDLSDDQFREAARLAMHECRFWPTPYDIKRLAPPARGAFRKTVAQPDGYRRLDSTETGELIRHRRDCERWFHAVTKAPVVSADTSETIRESPIRPGGYFDLLKKIIATQYLLAKKEIDKRESCKEEQHGVELPPDADEGALDLDSRALESLCEEEGGSVGGGHNLLRADEAGDAGADDEPSSCEYTEEEDDRDPRTV